MEQLSARDREFVALGAAVGSNCIPCVTTHVEKSRQLGIPDAQIRAAIDLAETVRQVPARAVLQAANSALTGEAMPNSGECSESRAPAAQRCC